MSAVVNTGRSNRLVFVRMSAAALAVGAFLCAVGFRPATAQDAEAPPKQPLVRPAFVDHADVTPPLDSFRYWLDTVTTTDEDFARVVRKARGLADGAKLDAAELREERVRRLRASFDFDELFAEAERKSNGAEGNELSAKQRESREADLIDYYLGSVVREQFAARNIRAMSAPEAPDWQKGTAHVLLDMFSTVEKQVIRYKVHMKLWPKGLMWRWYKSENLGEISDKGETVSSTTESSDDGMSRVDREIAALNASIEVEEATLAEVEERLERLRNQLSAKQAERVEIERSANPYGSPELSLRTAQKALKEKSWERFLASHTARVRDKSGPAAKSRFLNTASRDEVKNIAVIETNPDPANANRIMLKVRMTVSYREHRVYRAEEGESAVEQKEEKRVLTLPFLLEEGKWLLDEDI